MLDGPVCRQPAAAERRSRDRVEISDRKDVATGGNADVLRVAAVLEQPGLLPLRADHLLAGRAETALAAAPRCVEEHVADALDLGRDLVAEHEGKRRAEVSVGHVQVGVAHAAGEHLDDEIVAALRHRNRALLERER